MTRFDAKTPTERRSLYVDAIVAHRERGSPFLTIEVGEAELEGDDGPDPNLGIPWIQFGDGVVNLDCTEDELETLKVQLESFPAFKIDELTRPEDVPGVNVRISAKADPNRIAQFIDALFLEVYGLPEEYRTWVVAV